MVASDVQLPVSQAQVTRTRLQAPRVSRGQLHTPGSPPLNCLDYVNSDLAAIIASGERAGHCPPAEHQPNVAGTAGDYPTVSGQALAEVGQGGQQPIPFNNFRSTAYPVSRARSPLPSGRRMCSLQVRNIYFVGVPVPSSTRRPAWPEWCGTRPVASASPDRLTETLTQLGIDACSSGTGGGRGHVTSDAGYSDDEALCAFASDSVDLAYSAVGYGDRGRTSHRRTVKAARSLRVPTLPYRSR